MGKVEGERQTERQNDRLETHREKGETENSKHLRKAKGKSVIRHDGELHKF